MKKLIYTLLLITLSFSVQAKEQWTILEAPQGAGANWMASVTNSKGDKLGIWRKIVRIKFEAIGEFILGSGKLPKGVSIKYSVDDGQRISLDIIEQKGNRILWRVWSSTTNEIFEGDALWHLAQGRQLQFHWEDASGKPQQTTFTLTGSSKALSRIISGSYK